MTLKEKLFTAKATKMTVIVIQLAHVLNLSVFYQQ